MKKSSAVRVILVTAPRKDAEKIARTLLEQKLAACANLLPGVTSLYWWQGQLNRDAETLIIFKTDKRRVPALLKALKAAHSFEVPEFLALQVVEANPEYERWVKNNC